MMTLPIRTWVRNAAAVFSGTYGAVTRQAERAGCSRQTVYQHARVVERRLQAPAPAPPPAERADPAPAPAPTLDEPTRRRLAVTAFAMGLSTRQIEDLIAVIDPKDAPDHATVARWVAAEAQKAAPVLAALDEACRQRVETLAVDEVFFGGGRRWPVSSRRA
ncbi:alkaline phosphatase family protein [Tautonia sociabilis]|uniref:Uncharacterized protein n=1 Tax=Tautonia sociabilis TaxID=2080755 RepID=A0A432MCY0_9BACT|nr:hypothetical protein [Tautonia sociabilis]RUL81004.1 hypothetical protein TsocGM_25600 [Tautonia sociabilis]